MVVYRGKTTKYMGFAYMSASERVLLSAQIQTHAAKLIRLQMVNDQKSILLRVSQAKEIGYSSMDKSVS